MSLISDAGQERHATSGITRRRDRRALGDVVLAGVRPHIAGAEITVPSGVFRSQGSRSHCSVVDA